MNTEQMSARQAEVMTDAPFVVIEDVAPLFVLAEPAPTVDALLARIEAKLDKLLTILSMECPICHHWIVDVDYWMGDRCLSCALKTTQYEVN